MRLVSLAAAAAIVIALFTLGEKPYAGGLFPSPWDKLAHVSVYAAIALLVWIGSGGRAFPEGKAHRAGAVAVFVLAIGLLDELHQAGIPGRSADVSDLVADAIGIAIAFYLLRPRKTALKGNP
ncbi:MAG TPA: VanZ family protein [Burkholderiales bacterium]|jgi:VanZ family protein|nr:VanZ family protein [Burkholderiales bacterium]